MLLNIHSALQKIHVLIEKIKNYVPYRYKTPTFLSPGKREIVMERVFKILEHKEALREMATANVQSQPLVMTEPASAGTTQSLSEPPEKNTKKSMFNRLAGDVVDLSVPAENLRKEVNEYHEAMIKAGVRPLDWRAQHSYSFPNIADLAKKVPEVNIQQWNNVTFYHLF